MNYGRIENRSTNETLIATLRVPGEPEKTIEVPPGGCFPTLGKPQWHLWTFSWRPEKPSAPRRGLVRFEHRHAAPTLRYPRAATPEELWGEHRADATPDPLHPA